MAQTGPNARVSGPEMLTALINSKGVDRVKRYIEWCREQMKRPDSHVSGSPCIANSSLAPALPRLGPLP